MTQFKHPSAMVQPRKNPSKTCCRERAERYGRVMSVMADEAVILLAEDNDDDVTM